MPSPSDAAGLRQVVVNLSNSVKFTAAGEHVRVGVTCKDQAAVLVVSDNGIGIHPDLLRYVFQPFRQGESNTTTGLGLGLGIVKNLVELHGGRVAAESRGVGTASLSEIGSSDRALCSRGGFSRLADLPIARCLSEWCIAANLPAEVTTRLGRSSAAHSAETHWPPNGHLRCTIKDLSNGLECAPARRFRLDVNG
jgi:hypothetical protein